MEAIELGSQAGAGFTLSEEIDLCALDTMYYAHRFFPKAFRQESALFHPEIFRRLEDPSQRYVAIKVARDGAKTTCLRAFASKRIAFGISRTIVFVGKSEEAAMKSVDWLRRAVMYNHEWRETFGLEKGEQWSGSQIDIRNTVLGISIRVIAIGITGSTRGINIDDYRPDLIIVDDPCDEENTATPEQRLKINNLFFGSLYNSLAPKSDMPEAMMALLQTPLDGEDLIEVAMRDPSWNSASFSIFMPDGTSSWPQRYPTEELLKEKEAFTDRGQLNVWMREKEVTIVSDETTLWKKDFLQLDTLVPEGGVTYISCDPTPPPKEGNKVSSARAHRLDDFVIIAFKVYRGDIYILEGWSAKSPLPTEWQNKMFEMVVRWRPMRVGIETVLFARTIKYDLERLMREKQHFFQIMPIEDKRSKTLRITNELSGRFAARSVHCPSSLRPFIEQFTMYPLVSHDDWLDCLAIGCMTINRGMDSYIEGEYEEVFNDDTPALTWNRGAP